MKQNIERLGLVLISILTIGIMAASLYFEGQISNQKAMFYQLQAVRTSVNLYKAINKVNPENLKSLIEEEYRFPGENLSRRYLQSPTLNDLGELVDPFGQPYHYDKTTAWVRSTSKGYEFW